MSDATISGSYVETYNDSLEMLSQQERSLFRDAVTVDTGVTGEGLVPVEQIAAAEAIDIVSRYQEKPLVETVHDRRWVFPVHKGWGDIVDRIDKLKINIELNGKYTKTGVAAINRAIDTEVISKFFATALTGRSGGTSTTFPSGNIIAVDEGAAADTGMNVDKLLLARQTILEGDVNIENDMDNQLYCAISPLQERELLEQVKVVNKDYQDSAVLAGGGKMLKEWFGIKFIVSNRLNADSNTDRECPFWSKSGMNLSMWQDIIGDVSLRTDLNLNPDHISVNASFGSTRIEEAKVMKILCDES